MAFDIMESWRNYADTGAGDGIQAAWQNVGSAGFAISGTTLWGSPMLRVDNGTGSVGALRRHRGANRTSFCDGFWFKFVSLAASGVNSIFWRSLDVATDQLALVLRNDGAIRVFRGPSTEIAITDPGVIIEDTLVHIQMAVDIDNAAGGYALKINNETILTASGIDTQNTANNYSNAIQIQCPDGGGSVGDAYFAEVWAWDDSVTQGMLCSERRSILASPQQQWTPSEGVDNYAVIDEETVSAIDYLDALDAGDEDKFTVAAMEAGMLRCVAHKLSAFGRFTGSVPREVNLQLHSGVSVQDGPNLALPATPGLIERYSEVDPATGLAWTVGAGEAIDTIGLKLAV